MKPRPARFVIGVTVVAATLIAPSVAWGHAAFLDSQPEPGTRLPAVPGMAMASARAIRANPRPAKTAVYLARFI